MAAASMADNAGLQVDDGDGRLSSTITVIDLLWWPCVSSFGQLSRAAYVSRVCSGHANANRQGPTLFAVYTRV